MDTLDIDDPNERPTLPAPLSARSPSADHASRAAAMRAFDTQSEVFFSATATLPGVTHAEAALVQRTEADELTAWWLEQRRRTLVGWVAAAMALCAALVVAGLLAAPV
jgi:hypothetical protein